HRPLSLPGSLCLLAAACRVDLPVPVAVFAVAVAQIADQQATDRACTCAYERPAAATDDAANNGARRSADAHVPFSRRASREGKCSNRRNDHTPHTESPR